MSEPRSIIGTVVLDSHTSSSRLIVSRPSQCPIHPEHSSLSQTRREFIGLYRLLDDGLEAQYGHHPVPLFLPSDRGSLLQSTNVGRESAASVRDSSVAMGILNHLFVRSYS